MTGVHEPLLCKWILIYRFYILIWINIMSRVSYKITPIIICLSSFHLTICYFFRSLYRFSLWFLYYTYYSVTPFITYLVKNTNIALSRRNMVYKIKIENIFPNSIWGLSTAFHNCFESAFIFVHKYWRGIISLCKILYHIAWHLFSLRFSTCS